MNAPAGPPPLHEKDAPVLSLGAQGACWSLPTPPGPARWLVRSLFRGHRKKAIRKGG